LLAFAKAEGIDEKLMTAFQKFRLTVSGPEVGKAIQQMETDNFKKLL